MIKRSFSLAKMLWNERASRDDVWRIQNAAFLRLFNYAFENIPFYREIYHDLHILKDDIRTLADIHKLPIISKQQLHEAASSGKLWPRTDGYEYIETSGSSGTPFRFYVNRSDSHWRKAQYLLPYVSTGRRPWDSVLYLKGALSSHEPWLHKINLFREIRVLADMPVTSHYEALTELKPSILQGYPAALNLLALHILTRNLACPPLKTVYTDSEVLFPETRKLLSRVFKADVIDVFGSYETGNIAYECPSHSGYHLMEDSVYVESTPGDGELICTVFHNTVTPFIRYNLGDLVKLDSDPCDCGRKSNKISVLHGRANDLITFPDGSTRSAQPLVKCVASLLINAVNEFQIQQIDQNQFEIAIVQSGEFGKEDIAEVSRAIKNAFSFVTPTFRSVEVIKRTKAGKYKAFIGMDSDINRSP